jgi:hypothetical protein
MAMFLTSVIFGHTPMFLKLIGVLIAIGVAVVAYLLAEKLIGKGR